VVYGHGREWNDNHKPTHARLCLAFDGVDDWAQFADVPAARISNNFTLEFWFKSNNINQTNKFLLYRSGAQAVIRYGLTPGYVEFTASSYSGSDPGSGSQIPIADTDWHHIAYTYNGAQWIGYLDGQVVFSTARTLPWRLPPATGR